MPQQTVIDVVANADTDDLDHEALRIATANGLSAAVLASRSRFATPLQRGGQD